MGILFLLFAVVIGPAVVGACNYSKGSIIAVNVVAWGGFIYLSSWSSMVAAFNYMMLYFPNPLSFLFH